MFGGSREARDQGEDFFYKLPTGSWAELDEEAIHRLRVLQLQLARVLDPLATDADRESLPPARLAFRLFEAANQLFAEAAPAENDLRQVITTLRTALAVCWDIYSIREAESTTVAQHMTNLRERIEEFERDLGEIQAEREG